MVEQLRVHATAGAVVSNPHWRHAGELGGGGSERGSGGGELGGQGAGREATDADDTRPALLRSLVPKHVWFKLFLFSGDGAAIRDLSGYTASALRKWHFGMPYSGVPQGLLQAIPLKDTSNPLHSTALIGASLAHHSIADRLLRGRFGREIITYSKGDRDCSGPRCWVAFGRTQKVSPLPFGLECMPEEPFHYEGTWNKHVVTFMCAAAASVGKVVEIKAAFETAHLRHNSRLVGERWREAKYLQWLRGSNSLSEKFESEESLRTWMDDPCWAPMQALRNGSSEKERVRKMLLRAKAPKTAGGPVRCKTKTGMLAENARICADDILPPQLDLPPSMQASPRLHSTGRRYCPRLA